VSPLFLSSNPVMKAVEQRTMEQLRMGNDVPYLEYLRKELDQANSDLHGVEGDIYLGRLQGKAFTLKKILDDFERAGRVPWMRENSVRPVVKPDEPRL